mmetsp:Transcript_4861/g.6794  ORF Transcript_4861/g.6794 Transcript_4861/m.6794 type:complete len:204 (-) Transcript_4861:141-752(-)
MMNPWKRTLNTMPATASSNPTLKKENKSKVYHCSHASTCSPRWKSLALKTHGIAPSARNSSKLPRNSTCGSSLQSWWFTSSDLATRIDTGEKSSKLLWITPSMILICQTSHKDPRKCLQCMSSLLYRITMDLLEEVTTLLTPRIRTMASGTSLTTAACPLWKNPESRLLLVTSCSINAKTQFSNLKAAQAAPAETTTMQSPWR